MKEVTTPNGPLYVANGQAFSTPIEATAHELRQTIVELIESFTSNNTANVLLHSARFAELSGNLLRVVLSKESHRHLEPLGS
jgi:hypothetical protein